MTTATEHLPAPQGGIRQSISDSLVITTRNLRRIPRIPELAIFAIIQSIMFVLLFAFVFGGAIAIEGGGATYREYLIGGILIQSIAFGMTGPATAIANDLLEGVIDRFRSLPASKSAYLLGHYVAELGGMAVAIAVLLGAGLLVGWRQHTGPVYLVAGLLLLLAFASAMIWIGTWIGLTVRSPDAVMGVGFVVVFPLTFVSNAFVPIESMPPVLQWIAAWNPISAMVAAVRELFGNPTAPLTQPSWPLENPVLASVIYCTVLLAVFIPLALRRYKVRTSD